MPALADFEARYQDARALGDMRTRLAASYEQEKDAIRLRPESPDYDAVAKAAEVAAVEARQVSAHRTLILTEIVQLFTAWEVFLREKFVEALSMNPAHLQRLLSLGGPPVCTPDTGTSFLENAPGRPSFQALGEARDLYRRYFGFKPLLPAFADRGVRAAAKLRHVSVHRAGQPTAIDQEYADLFGSHDSIWLIAERPDADGTARLAGPGAPVMTFLETSAESLLYGAYYVDNGVR
jgi:hypothetical protein